MQLPVTGHVCELPSAFLHQESWSAGQIGLFEEAPGVWLERREGVDETFLPEQGSRSLYWIRPEIQTNKVNEKLRYFLLHIA